MIRSSFRLVLVAIVCIGILTGSATAQESPTSAVEVPAALTPPVGSVLLFELAARGVQIYACAAKEDDPAAFVWTLQGPDAELFNSRGELVGAHFAGPTWQIQDESAVVAAAVERADAPESGAVAWLLLEATEHAENGALSTVTHIQRLDTAGGAAPAAGCDADHAGAETREPYEATYAFFYPAAPAA